MDWWPSPENNSSFIFILYWLEILEKRTSLSVPPLPLGPLKYDSQHAHLCPNSQYFPLSWDTCTNRILPRPPLVLHQHPKCLWISIKCSPLEPTIKVVQTYIFTSPTQQNQRKTQQICFIHHPFPSNPHRSPTNITAWPFSSGCSGAALAFWRVLAPFVMSESS